MPDRAGVSVSHALAPVARPPFACIALLLQGGGALGAYQGGVYQALAEAQLHPDWVAGISIGAINAAIIAGNAPEARVEKLRAFWEEVTQPSPFAWWSAWLPDARTIVNQLSAASTLLAGVDGFFSPRIPPAWLQLAGAPGATSYYDTAPLRATLERLVDFDRINAHHMRLSAGAVNVASGNFVYFDTTTHRIGPEHILASGALPPGLPAIAIDGQCYWDGGLVSNTPLQWVLQYGPRQDTLAFQVDLWSARGRLPHNLAEVATRQKEILYSSRTRENTDQFTNLQNIRHAVAKLMKVLPSDAAGSDIDALRGFADDKVYNIVHLIYRAAPYEGDSKDYEFSRASMQEHWSRGYQDTVKSLAHPEVLARPSNADGVAVFDFLKNGEIRKQKN